MKIGKLIYANCRRSLASAVLSLTIAGAVACSSVTPPRAQISQAELALLEAEEKKAMQYAPLEVRTAREKLAASRQAMRREDFVSARRLAEQALVDAQLAVEVASSESARRNAAELRTTIETLRTEMEQRRKR